MLVNSLGATPVEELFILYNRIAARIDDAGLTIAHPLVGRYATSMEMAGASLTVLPLDGELEAISPRRPHAPSGRCDRDVDRHRFAPPCDRSIAPGSRPSMRC